MIHVEYRFRSNSYDVFVCRYIDDDFMSFLTIDDEGREHWSEPQSRFMCQPENSKPTYHIKDLVARELVTQLTKLGVKPVEQSKVEGQYEAQSKHLADLQRLVFREKRS